ncbi:ABC transporter ATP-binding protein [Actinotignum urinale]|uniref:ABC transporter ATP-binding protein n=1 Tax=Actinotignum urinale TaxID=190146 RepID=UPI0003FD33BD|nr:ATP-binding cassette domain-containing protein [Actinotignum urinale]MDY5160713.1 ATP-binding cassette domain-containing protein [Actinotignum urinale]
MTTEQEKERALEHAGKNENEQTTEHAGEHATELFRVQDITKRYRDTVALAPTSFTLNKGESLGIIGESGSGKTTLTRLMLGLSEPSGGSVTYRGEKVVAGKRGLNRLRREVQLVLQDPFASLNPRITIGRIISEPLQLLHTPGDHRDMVRQALEKVRINPDWASRYPHQLSGGQRQRVAIARAIASNPQVIIADEPVSALDVSVRATVIDLLADLRHRLDLTLVVVSHDLGIVQQLCENIMVLRSGTAVEYGTTQQILLHPQHPATRELLDAVPTLPLDDE